MMSTAPPITTTPQNLASKTRNKMARTTITPMPPTFIRALPDILRNASAPKPALATMTCKDLQFHGIVLWEDSEGYEIDWHTDNPLLMATIQIYVAGSTDNPGTEFKLLDGSTHTCDFKINTGSLIDQTKHRLSHHSTGRVPDLARRYSLFAMWK